MSSLKDLTMPAPPLCEASLERLFVDIKEWTEATGLPIRLTDAELGSRYRAALLRSMAGKPPLPPLALKEDPA